MKEFNRFWMVIWGVILSLAITAIFWRPAVYVIAVIALVFFILFIHDFNEARGV